MVYGRLEAVPYTPEAEYGMTLGRLLWAYFMQMVVSRKDLNLFQTGKISDFSCDSWGCSVQG